MDEDIYILIEQYLAGELSPEETKAFENRIKSDPELAEKVGVYRSLSENLKSRFTSEQVERQLRESLSAIAKAEVGNKSGKVISLQWYHWAAAASLALIAVFWFYTTTSITPQYDDYSNHGSLSLAERGDDSLKHQAEDAFNSGNYDQAISFFNRLLDADPDNTELQLYKGISLLELDRYKEAEAIFHVIKNSETIYQDKAMWYLALSALKQKDYDKCKTLLDQLSPDSEYHKQAEEIRKGL
jgi:tetratricopeptide (TPR) repeat protein